MSKVKLYLLFFMSFLFSELCSAIEPILVTENTFKLNGEETLYYGFAAGDQIIFDFKEANGKTVKEVEIVEMPSNTKFQDFKTAEINNKKIKVESNGLYAFRFKNPIVAGRICKIKIQRIPDDESKISFDTGWHYENVNDTTFIPYTEDSLTGYVEEKYIETVPELVETKYSTEELVYTSIDLKTRGYIKYDNPRFVIKYSLPYEKTSTYEKQVKRLAIWFGTGDDAEAFLQKSKEKALKSAKEEIKDEKDDDLLSSLIKTGIDIYKDTKGAATDLVIGAVKNLAIPSEEAYNQVKYYITKWDNGKKWYDNGKNEYTFINDNLNIHPLYEGKGSGLCTRFIEKTMTRGGEYALCLENPNKSDHIRVFANISVLIEENTYKNVDYERVRQVPQYVTLHKNKYKIKTTKEIRMNGK
ncbi:MAG: hypothetical protein KBT22_03175 [Bacteroidales bacterium]|nr:hypothetical protein [Candidatus Scybalocola fimicaballi]